MIYRFLMHSSFMLDNSCQPCNSGLLLLEFGFVLIGDNESHDFAYKIYHILCHNIHHYELSLVSQVYRFEILRLFYQKITWTSSATILKSIVLEEYKPDKSDEVIQNDKWPHSLKHVIFALQVIKYSWNYKNSHSKEGEHIELFADINCVRVLHPVGTLVFGEALVLLNG